MKEFYGPIKNKSFTTLKCILTKWLEINLNCKMSLKIVDQLHAFNLNSHYKLFIKITMLLIS